MIDTSVVEVDKSEFENFPLDVYGSRLFVIESEISDRTSSGLFIPSNQSEIVATDGIVIAVGKDVEFCKPGDRVYYARYSGAACSINGKSYRVMNEEDLMGKWRK